VVFENHVAVNGETAGYTVGNGASSVVPVDLNGDGYPDLVLTNHQSVVVLVNDGLWPAEPGGINDSLENNPVRRYSPNSFF
jgi:hypothetical protein